MKVSPYAGVLPEPSDLIDIPSLIRAYQSKQPDPTIATQQVRFGTSGHRGCSLDITFNENHILAITQAICWYRKIKQIGGPLFLGMDTHALSVPAYQSALEVLAANDVTVLVAPEGEFTPTPVISHAILSYNRGRKEGLADGIVITPSHNPPREGGFKYNPAHGGPAEITVTDWIQNRANEVLKNGLSEVRRFSFSQAENASTTHRHDYLGSYVRDLGNVVDLDVIRDSKIKLGVDPMGGAGIRYWPRIAELYKIDLTITNSRVDPCFSFIPRDWDGQIRMDPSSPYAMRGLIEQKGIYDLSFACDTDHDRHGIVTPSEGLMAPNHYLAVAIDYLLRSRPLWKNDLKIGKTIVSSQIIDRVTASFGHLIYEVPVGFKWFVEGLLSGSIGFAGEESAGASFLRKNGESWTTDKDGFIPALLAAEMTARFEKNPAVLYHEIGQRLGDPIYRRVEAQASDEQNKRLQEIAPTDFSINTLAGDKISKILTRAPGNDAAINGIKVETENGWFAARPSGTEEIYKIYAESFVNLNHLEWIIKDAQAIVDSAIGSNEKSSRSASVSKSREQ